MTMLTWPIVEAAGAERPQPSRNTHATYALAAACA